MPSPPFRFPPGFLFGAATAATQVEGGCETSDWAEFARTPGHVHGGDTPQVACDSWNRWQEDVALLRCLGLNSYRFSIEWARLEPEPGRFDLAAFDRYREILGALRDAGIEPLLTLHHFTLPLWQSRRGGLLDRELPRALERFTRQAVRALGDLCNRWVTVNEPSVVAAFAYVLGVWPPGRKSVPLALKAQHNLLAAHLAMYRVLKGAQGDAASVGVAHHLRVIEPERPRNPSDRAGAMLLRWLFNDGFARALCEGTHYGPFGMGLAEEARGTHDFFGVNYYTRDLVRFDPRKPDDVFLPRTVKRGSEINDLGWEVYPEGLGHVLKEWAGRSGRPLLVTENGLADRSDRQRPSFLVRHLAEVAHAIESGIDVRGYFHWTLMDNFEWAEGYAAHFGLAATDFENLKRTLRPSASLYARIAAERAIDAATWERYRQPPQDAPRAP